jgi:predicted phosphodiesterase
MTTTTLVAGDIHYPFHDVQVWKLFLEFAKWLKPNMVILNGDIGDWYALSKFDRDPIKPTTIVEELKGIGEDILGPLALATKGAKLRIIRDGNHEDRLRRFIWHKAPELAGYEKLTIPALYDSEKHGYTYVGGSVRSVQLGKLEVIHGEYLSKHSAMSGKAHFDRLGTSVLVGHSHRLGAFYQTNMRGMHGAWEGGCLCSLVPEYENFPNWQQGWAVVTTWPSKLFNVQLVPVLDRRYIVYGGKEWSS